jgi:hypothetical protein
MAEKNPQADYWLLLAIAYDAGEAVDMFDLREDDPASCREWERLCEASAEAQCDLLRYIETNGRRLRQIFET